MSQGGQNASSRSGQLGPGRGSDQRGRGNSTGSAQGSRGTYVQEGPRVLGTGRAVSRTNFGTMNSSGAHSRGQSNQSNSREAAARRTQHSGFASTANTRVHATARSVPNGSSFGAGNSPLRGFPTGSVSGTGSMGAGQTPTQNHGRQAATASQTGEPRFKLHVTEYSWTPRGITEKYCRCPGPEDHGDSYTPPPDTAKQLWDKSGNPMTEEDIIHRVLDLYGSDKIERRVLRPFLPDVVWPSHVREWDYAYNSARGSIARRNQSGVQCTPVLPSNAAWCGPVNPKGYDLAPVTGYGLWARSNQGFHVPRVL